MRLVDAFWLSVNNILHRKLRAWLTLLGIVIGVAAVVAIVSIGEGAQQNVIQRLSGLGADILTITPGFNSAGGFFGGFRGEGFSNSGFRGERATGLNSNSRQSQGLTVRDAVVIRANPNVLKVNEIVSDRGELVFLSEKTNTTIQGVNPNSWKDTSNVEIGTGRLLTASDSSAIVIGGRLANDTFKQPLTLGRQVSVEGHAFTVVGILKPSGTETGFGAGDTTIYMPYTSAWEVTDVNKGNFSSIQAKVSDASLIQQATDEITQSLLISRRVTERNQNFSVTSSQAIQARVSDITQTLTLFLGAIAAVSLLVGAVGIANSMFTSVLEKTKEIGIMKALGSTNGEILALFIIESGLFGLAGGIIGVAIGIIASIGISSLGLRLIGVQGEVITAVPLQLIIGAIIMSTIIGIVSGIMPARAASQLKPVEALRYE